MKRRLLRPVPAVIMTTAMAWNLPLTAQTMNLAGAATTARTTISATQASTSQPIPLTWRAGKPSNKA